MKMIMTMTPSSLFLALALSSSPEIDAIVEPLRAAHDVPGVGIALVRGGEIVHVAGYGVADARSGAPVGERTVFSLGSVSKAFAAVTVMQLVESGKVALDDPVGKHLPNFPHSDARKITLRHLLSHTSGFPRLPEWGLPTRADIVGRLATIALEAPPGEAWRYCNQNFILAGHVVERVLGTPWDEVLRGSVLAPLEMDDAHTDFDRARTDRAHAQPHVLDVRRGSRRIEFETHLGPWGPSGGVHASARDMARWVRFQVGDGAPVLKKASLAEMHREQVSLATAPAARERRQALPVEKMGYGLGWYTEEFRSNRLVTHDGTLDGFTASVTLVPNARSGLAILTNGDHANSFVHALRLRLVEWLLGLEKRGDVVLDVHSRAQFEPSTRRARLEAARTFRADPASFAPFIGKYRGLPPGGPDLVVAGSGDGLSLTIVGQVTIELVPFEQDGFLGNSGPMIGAPLKFQRAADGTVVILAGDQQVGTKGGG